MKFFSNQKIEILLDILSYISNKPNNQIIKFNNELPEQYDKRRTDCIPKKTS